MNFKSKTIILLAVIFFSAFFGLGEVRASVCADVDSCVNCAEGQSDFDCSDTCIQMGNTFSNIENCDRLPWCFCSDNVADIKEGNYAEAESTFASVCMKVLTCDKDVIKKTAGTKYSKCNIFGSYDASKTVCDAAKSEWEAKKVEAIKKFGGYVEEQQGLISKIIPNCALRNDLGPDSPCRDATIFVAMGINVASYLFGIVGALALLMFVYGGITLAISMGNPEKVKKGGEILLAALIGLAIVFGSYVLVRFLGEAIGVSSNLL